MQPHSERAPAERAVIGGYLCTECGASLGGEVPADTRPTLHLASCPICRNVRQLMHWSDWNWPANKIVNENAQTLRKQA